MILYVDSSALVKYYILENGSLEVKEAIAAADIIGMSVIGRVEMAAAFAKAVRIHRLPKKAALQGFESFRNDWKNFAQLKITNIEASQAEFFAWNYQLRGYDAAHLAVASMWQEVSGKPVTFATFDLELWKAAQHIGLISYPPKLEFLLEEWKKDVS